METLRPPAQVLRIARRLEEAGFETWCVGGAIRDALLGHRHQDWDLATAARPEQVQRLFRRTVPVGIEFGTVGVLDDDGVLHEVTTFRKDVATDGRHAVVEFGASLDEDLARRDFSINAIAYSPATGRIHDPFGGRDDLERRLVRAVGVPQERMAEDRLRALRAIRFASRFGFDIEANTWSAVIGSTPFLDRLSPERVRQELEKTMEQVDCPSGALRRWRESGALAELIPSLAALSDITLRSLDAIVRPVARNRRHGQRKHARIAALFADLSPKDTRRALENLRFSNRDVAWITTVLDRWRQLHPGLEKALQGEEASDAQVRRWVAMCGRTKVDFVLRLAAARVAAEHNLAHAAPALRRMRSLYRRMVRSAFRDPVEVGDLAIDGDDLRRAGISEGPVIGRLQRYLLDAVLTDPSLNNGETLLEMAQSFLKTDMVERSPSRPAPKER
ncbi:MAG: CCA tRNA nucleotidyltransferase [Gemmatimonadaceae bacterium]